MRVAYFISSYGPGEQLGRLIDRIRVDEPDAPIVVHHDVGTQRLANEAELIASGVHVINAAEPIVWGDITLEAARWRVFRWILANLDVDWVMLLSEQDYPVLPLRALHERIAASGADAIIEAQRVDRIADPVVRREMTNRYFVQWHDLPQLGLDRRLPPAARAVTEKARYFLYSALGRLQSRVVFYRGFRSLDVGTRIGLSSGRTIFSEDFPCWKNECWCAISTRALRVVLTFLDQNPDFVEYYSRTVIPLESATATILFNDPTIRVENASLHAIRWSDHASGRPDELTLDDLDHLRAAGASGMVFARKFRSGAAVLDQLDGLAKAARDSSEMRTP